VLADLFPNPSGQSDTGRVDAALAGGYYHVAVGSVTLIAKNQAGEIRLGAIVTVTRTKWGNFIVSTAGVIAETTRKIVING
jgi:hypothetical protein